MATFDLGGKTIQVDTHRTWWPLSVFYKRQGVTVQVNPETHWWCAWLCRRSRQCWKAARGRQDARWPKTGARVPHRGLDRDVEKYGRDPPV